MSDIESTESDQPADNLDDVEAHKNHFRDNDHQSGDQDVEGHIIRAGRAAKSAVAATSGAMRPGCSSR